MVERELVFESLHGLEDRDGEDDFDVYVPGIVSDYMRTYCNFVLYGQRHVQGSPEGDLPIRGVVGNRGAIGVYCYLVYLLGIPGPGIVSTEATAGLATCPNVRWMGIDMVSRCLSFVGPHSHVVSLNEVGAFDIL